jgi:DNA-binding XRE family transcriptional regulator
MKPADNVRKIREERLISKMELARLAGISAATIDRIERSEICRMETKRKIIFALGFTLSEKSKVFPNSLMAPIHDRIPVILHLTEFDHWLDRSLNNPEKLQRFYQPYPSELLQEWEVSTIANNASNETPETIEAVQSV